MEITQAQYERIKHLFPKQRGNVAVSNLVVLNALLYVAEHGCNWRGLPERFGKWYTVYKRLDRWAKNDVLGRVLEGLADEGIINLRVDTQSVDATIVKVDPDGRGARKMGFRFRSGSPGMGGPPRFIWSPPMPAPQ